jgi:2-polyprenyl-3-methyl-5-hydroxy-6-metoxy-1,4-benzoquinol methylase/glycosyltransferase involved in cell wall biosynthesis
MKSDLTMTSSINTTKKPTIVLLVDRHGGAFDIIAQSIVKRLSSRFEFIIRYVVEKPDLNAEHFDVLFVFFWGERYHEQFSIAPHKIIKEVASHRWALEELYGKLSVRDFVKTYLTNCGFVTTPSRRLFNQISPFLETIFWCPNGIETDLFNFKRPRNGPLRIGWVGNPRDECKGLHDILVPACKDRFRFAFSNGLWSRGKTAAFYNSIDVIAIASEGEGQPLPLMEGMACGCFPVSTDVGIVPELITTGYNGLIVGRSVESFRNAFLWCEENLDRIRRVGRYNAVTCRQVRSWDVQVERIAHVFEIALAVRPFARELPMENDSNALLHGKPVIHDELQNTLQDYAHHLKRMNPGNISEAAYLSTVPYYKTELKPLLPVNRESRIVDIGTGFGHLPRYLLENGYLHVGAVDSSAELLRQVTEYLGKGPEFLIHQGALEFLQGKPGSFDVITCFDVVEHINPQRQQEMIQAVFQALKPGGRVILRTPNMANILGIYSRYMDLTHVHGFTEFSLFQLLQNGGFTNPQVHIPRLFGTRKEQFKKNIMRSIHRRLYRWQDRVTPRSFDKNVVVWADRGG